MLTGAVAGLLCFRLILKKDPVYRQHAFATAAGEGSVYFQFAVAGHGDSAGGYQAF